MGEAVLEHGIRLGVISGNMEVSDGSAALLLLMPMMLIQIGWGKIAIPHGATLREEGNIHRFFKEQILSSLVFLLAVAPYVAFVLAFSGELQNHLLSEKYPNSFQYVVIWGAIFVAGFAAINASFGLPVMMEFRTITKISFFILLVTVGSAYFLIQRYGIAGGPAALLLGQILLAVGLWIPFGKNVISLQKKQKTVLMEKDGSLKRSENPP